MRYEHTITKSDNEITPATLKGYKYLVEVKRVRYNINPPSYQMDINIDKAVTVDKIWQCEGELLNSTHGGHLKDLCLSFSLFWLLLRRYGGYPLHENTYARHKTQRFVLDGLVGHDHDHERVFRVIEVELNFLYDYFYTKYYASYVGHRQFLRRFTLLALLSSSFAYILIIGIGIIEEVKPVDYFFANLCTIIVIIIIIVVEIVQLGILLTSKWSKVKWI